MPTLIGSVVAVGVVGIAFWVTSTDWSREPQRITRDLQINASAETTRFSGPIREDGTIDYITAINRDSQARTDVEHNAFIELMFVLGIDEGSQQRESMLSSFRLSNDHASALPRFIAWEDHVSEHIEEHLDAQQIKDLLDEVLDTPFDHEQSALLASWIDRNAEAMDHCATALEKPGYWIPLIAQDEVGLLVSASFFVNEPVQQLAMAYRAQLITAARSGNADQAVLSIRAIRRLGMLHSNQLSLVEGLVAIAVHAQGVFGLRQVLDERYLSSEALGRIAQEWGTGGDRVPLVKLIDEFERCMILDGLMQLASGRSTLIEFMGADYAGTLETGLFAQDQFDINLGLSLVQQTFDELVEMMHEADYATFQDRLSSFEQHRSEAIDQIDAELMLEADGFQRPINGLDNHEYTVALTRKYIQISIPSLHQVRTTELRVTANERNMAAAIAVERYRLDHNELPYTLGELVPTYLDSVPDDPFDGQPIRYIAYDDGYVVYSIGSNLRDDEGYDDPTSGDTAIDIRWPEPRQARIGDAPLQVLLPVSFR